MSEVVALGTNFAAGHLSAETQVSVRWSFATPAIVEGKPGLIPSDV